MELRTRRTNQLNQISKTFSLEQAKHAFNQTNFIFISLVCRIVGYEDRRFSRRDDLAVFYPSEADG